MTGWGQDGPIAHTAGHDINYIALSGALHAIGTADKGPVPPLNLVGDFGGGGLMLAFGMLAGIIRARSTGVGEVVDAAMVDGAATLGAFVWGLAAGGGWTTERGANLLDTGTPFYDVYETADGGYMAVGALEPQFYAALVAGLVLPPDRAAEQWDRDRWEEHRAEFARIFASADRDTWAARFEGTDGCVAPVLDHTEAPLHPHLAARGTFTEVGGVVQPAPAPRFRDSPAGAPTAPVAPGTHTAEILADLGFSADEVEALTEGGAVA
jgi:alpha-methylacyl-CoA racemase